MQPLRQLIAHACTKNGSCFLSGTCQPDKAAVDLSKHLINGLDLTCNDIYIYLVNNLLNT